MILISVSELQRVARLLIGSGDQLQRIAASASRSMASLEWQALSRASVQDQIGRASLAGADLQREMEAMAAFLRDVAQRFQELDREESTLYDALAQKYPAVFVRGPSLADVRQRKLGDCGLVAALGALAHSSPGVLERAIRYDANTDEYVVTLYGKNAEGNWEPVEVRVTDDFSATSEAGKHAVSGEAGELWVSLMEKAYVKATTGGTSLAHYEQVAGVSAEHVLEAVAGREVVHVNDLQLALMGKETLRYELTSALSAGRPVCYGVKETLAEQWANFTWWKEDLGPADIVHNGTAGLVGQHYYTVLGIQGDVVTLHNPWGTGPNGTGAEITLTLDEFAKYAGALDVGI